MRISTAWAQQLSVNSMNTQQTLLAATNQQLSSGIRVTAPADDPAAAVSILNLNKTIAQTNQYQSTIATAQGALNTEGAALTTATNILDSAQTLTTQAMNASLNGSDRLSIKMQVDQLIQEMAGVANTQNANGQYLFSGDLGGVPAFAQNASGAYVYQGGPQQAAVQIAPARQVAISDVGANVFGNIKSSSPTADQNGNTTILGTLQALSAALASASVPTAAITGNTDLRAGLDYTLTPASFILTANGGASVPINLNTNFPDLASMVGKINSQLGTAGSPIQAQIKGNNIEFVSTTTGSTASIAINNTSGTFLTDAGFSRSSNNLNSSTGNTAATPAAITGSSFLRYGVTYPSFPPTQFTLSATAETLPATVPSTPIAMTPPTIDLSDMKFANINDVVAEINKQLAATSLAPADVFPNTGLNPNPSPGTYNDAIKAQSNGNSIEFVSVATGAVSSIGINNVSGTFLADAGFSNGQTYKGADARSVQNTLANGLTITGALNQVLTDIGASQNSILQAQTSNGTRLNALTDQQNQHASFILAAQTTLAATQDIDYAQATSNFQLQTNALQAAQQAFAKVAGLSLFNYI